MQDYDTQVFVNAWIDTFKEFMEASDLPSNYYDVEEDECFNVIANSICYEQA